MVTEFDAEWSKTSANVSPMSSATTTTATTPPAAVRAVEFGGGGTDEKPKGACRFWGTSGGCRRGGACTSVTVRMEFPRRTDAMGAVETGT